MGLRFKVFPYSKRDQLNSSQDPPVLRSGLQGSVFQLEVWLKSVGTNYVLATYFLAKKSFKWESFGNVVTNCFVQALKSADISGHVSIDPLTQPTIHQKNVNNTKPTAQLTY